MTATSLELAVSSLYFSVKQTVTFRNPFPKALPGEVEFPLPDGAVVSGFATSTGKQVCPLAQPLSMICQTNDDTLRFVLNFLQDEQGSGVVCLFVCVSGLGCGRENLCMQLW